MDDERVLFFGEMYNYVLSLTRGSAKTPFPTAVVIVCSGYVTVMEEVVLILRSSSIARTMSTSS